MTRITSQQQLDAIIFEGRGALILLLLAAGDSAARKLYERVRSSQYLGPQQRVILVENAHLLTPLLLKAVKGNGRGYAILSDDGHLLRAGLLRDLLRPDGQPSATLIRNAFNDAKDKWGDDPLGPPAIK